MNNFTIKQKTALHFGKGEENNVGSLIKEYADSCLIVHDGGSYLDELLKRVKASLDKEGIRYFELPGVTPNPRASYSNKGIELCQQNDLGFVLAVGGGSVMDTAKYIAFSCHYPGDKCGFTPADPATHRVLPHGVVLTMSGTGSEFSPYSMIVNDLTDPVVKLSLAHDQLAFDFAVVNPELTYTLPAFQTAAGAFDIISHSMEAYFNETADAPLAEAYFEGIIRTVMHETPFALANASDYTARSNLSIAAMMAMNINMAFAGLPQDWGAHHCEAQITTTYHKTHGATLAAITPSWLRYTYKRNVPKYTKWAVNCMHAELDPYHPEITIENGIRRLEDWIKQVGLPKNLHELGVTLEEANYCAKLAAPAGFVYQLPESDILEIYKLAE